VKIQQYFEEMDAIRLRKCRWNLVSDPLNFGFISKSGVWDDLEELTISANGVVIEVEHDAPSLLPKLQQLEIVPTLARSAKQLDSRLQLSHFRDLSFATRLKTLRIADHGIICDPGPTARSLDQLRDFEWQSSHSEVRDIQAMFRLLDSTQLRFLDIRAKHLDQIDPNYFSALNLDHVSKIHLNAKQRQFSRLAHRQSKLRQFIEILPDNEYESIKIEGFVGDLADLHWLLSQKNLTRTRNLQINLKLRDMPSQENKFVLAEIAVFPRLADLQLNFNIFSSLLVDFEDGSLKKHFPTAAFHSFFQYF